MDARYVLVPADEYESVVTMLGPKLNYPLKTVDVGQLDPAIFAAYDVGDRVRELRDHTGDGGRVGTVVGFGFQPSGYHLVVKVDGNPPEREGFFLLHDIAAWESKEGRTGFGVVDLPPKNPGQED